MKVKQLICFSWNEEDRVKGFHVFAQSSGIDERDIYAIAKRLVIPHVRMALSAAMGHVSRRMIKQSLGRTMHATAARPVKSV